MAKVNYPHGSKRKSPFFALTRKGDSLVASFTNPRKIVEILKKNSRNRDKVFSVSNN